MSYYDIIKVVSANHLMDYVWLLETASAKELPNPLKYKYVIE